MDRELHKASRRSRNIENAIRKRDATESKTVIKRIAGVSHRISAAQRSATLGQKTQTTSLRPVSGASTRSGRCLNVVVFPPVVVCCCCLKCHSGFGLRHQRM